MFQTRYQDNDEHAILGSTCESERDCAAFDKDGKTKLCCQKVSLSYILVFLSLLLTLHCNTKSSKSNQ